MTLFSDPIDYDGIVGAGILALVAILGLTVNLTAIVLLFRVPILNNCFGYLNASHLVADCGILLACLAWAAPMAILQSDAISESFFGKRIGQLAMFFWYGALYSHLVLSLNRFIAILRPKQYTSMFDDRKQKLVVIIWFIATLHAVVFSFDACSFFFSPKTLLWEFSKSRCAYLLSVWFDFAHGMTLCTVVLFIDCMSIFQLRKKAKKLTVFAVKARFNRDRRFFLQTLTSEVVLCLMMLSFHWISRLAETKWASFFLITFLWELAHSMTGLIMFYFNRELRRALCCALLGNKNNSDVNKKSVTVVRF